MNLICNELALLTCHFTASNELVHGTRAAVRRAVRRAYVPAVGDVRRGALCEGTPHFGGRVFVQVGAVDVGGRGAGEPWLDLGKTRGEDRFT